MTARALHLLLVATLLAACQVGTAAERSVPDETTPPTAAAVTSTAAPTERPSATASRSPSSSPSPSPAPTIPPPEAFALNLFEAGDFVPQHTFDWCVGASIQMAWNMVRGDTRGSYEDQEALWEMARRQSSNSFNGANPRGWAATLNEIGVGPYQLVTVPEYEEALRTAAAAIRDTGRPVGLVMWRGRHAWVMSGFESLGDPAVDEDFVVTGIHVLDPLYPHGDATWGLSPEPNALLTPEELARQYKARDKRSWTYDSPTGYVMILPVAATGQD
jgi:hypothetical protein